MRYFLAAAMLACTFLLFSITPNVFGSSPAISFQESVFTFQPVLEGESVEIAFEFCNAGGEPLVIHDAVTSCGCTTADYPSYPLRPGQSGMIKTTFHSKGHSGDNEISLLVKSNDPVAPVMTLRIKGKVIRQWQVKPDRFILTNLKADRRYTGRLKINNFMEESLQIRELVPGSHHLNLLSEPKRVAPNGNGVIDFEVSVQDLEAGGIAQFSIRIKVANAEMKSVEIPVLIKLK